MTALQRKDFLWRSFKKFSKSFLAGSDRDFIFCLCREIIGTVFYRQQSNGNLGYTSHNGQPWGSR
jgi:hypothetical protein